MKRNLSHLIVIAAVSVAGVLMTGCTAAQANPQGDQSRFALTPSRGVVFGALDVYQEGDSTVITGKIRRTFNNCCDAERGHVDIALLAPDHSVLDMVSVSYTPRDMPRVRSRASRFTARLGYVLPDTVTIRVTYHEHSEVTNVSSDDMDSFPCQYI